MAGVILQLISCGHSGGELPARLDRFPADLTRQQLEVSGIYSDGWVAENAAVNLQQPGGDQALSIRGTVPRIADPAFRTEVRLLINNSELGRRSVGIGDFQLSAPVRIPAGKQRVSVVFSASQQLPADDGRAVGAQLKFLGFEPAKSAPNGSAPDITLDSRIELGTGWGPIEVYRNEHFRWVDNDAQILITPNNSGEIELILALEAGPGAGGKCLLKALDASGRQVAATPVKERATATFFLPVEDGKRNEFRLHVDGGGKHIATDPRVLNFRVFQISTKPFDPARDSRPAK
jgi:hypothetical protein